MFHVAPLLFAAACALVSILFSLTCSGYVYQQPFGATGPYEDAGFAFLPDWSSAVTWLPQTFAVLHGLAFTIFTLFHQHRVTILRRALLILSMSALMQESQMLCTSLPCPNPSFAVALRPGGWSYDLYVVQYTVASFMVGFFFSPLLWAALWSGAGCVGALLLIATRRYYTVDVVCNMVPPVLVFLLYHWYARSEVAIMKRNVVYWLERDVFLIDCRSTSSHCEEGPDLIPSRATSPVSWLDGLMRWTLDEHRWIPMHWDKFLLERNGVYSIYPNGCVFAVTDGRGPSDATLHAEDTIQHRRQVESTTEQTPPTSSHERSPPPTLQPEQMHDGDEEATSRAIAAIHEDPGIQVVNELVERARRMNEKERQWTPQVVAVVFIVAGVSVGLLNLVSIHYADQRRPLHIPLPPDVVHDLIPALPDHAADFFIYPIVLCTFGFTIASRFTWVILYRISIIYGMSMSLRMITMLVTSLPDPSPACAERAHADGTTCGDLIYSGHTVGFLMCAFTFRYFTREKRWGVMTWSLTAGGLFCVIASRLHYTKDVIVSLYVIALANHVARVVLFKRVSLVRSSRWAWILECGYYSVIAQDRDAHVATNHHLEGQRSAPEELGP